MVGMSLAWSCSPYGLLRTGTLWRSPCFQTHPHGYSLFESEMTFLCTLFRWIPFVQQPFGRVSSMPSRTSFQRKPVAASVQPPLFTNQIVLPKRWEPACYQFPSCGADETWEFRSLLLLSRKIKLTRHSLGCKGKQHETPEINMGDCPNILG